MSTRLFIFVIGALVAIGMACEAWNTYDRLRTRDEFDRRITVLEKKLNAR